MQKIGKLLLALRDNHNTVLVVEHSRQMIELADHVVEMGPLAGAQGGQVIFQGYGGTIKTDGHIDRSLYA